MRIARFFGFLVGFKFLVERRRLRAGSSGRAVFLVFLGGHPVNQRLREFLPFPAFSAHVAHALTLDLILAYKLIGPVFEDETFGELLRRTRSSESKNNRRDNGDCGAGFSEHQHD